jgi:hypothetical protein
MIKLAERFISQGFKKVFNFFNLFPWQVKFVAVAACIAFPVSYFNYPVGTAVLFRNFLNELAFQGSAMFAVSCGIAFITLFLRSAWYHNHLHPYVPRVANFLQATVKAIFQQIAQNFVTTFRDVVTPIFRHVVMPIFQYMMRPVFQVKYWLLRSRFRAKAGLSLLENPHYLDQCKDALAYAAQRGLTDRVKFFLALGMEVDTSLCRAPLYDGSALLYAAGNGHVDTVKVLLAAGADPKLESLVGPSFAQVIITPLDQAIFGRHRAVAFILLKKITENMSGAEFDLWIATCRHTYTVSNSPIILEYRLHILKKTLFESVRATLTAMYQADAGKVEPQLIIQQILPMFKPDWCSDDDYAALSKEVVKNTLKVFFMMDVKSNNAAKEYQVAVLKLVEPQPVIFRRDPKLKATQAANDVVIEVLPEKTTNSLR